MELEKRILVKYKERLIGIFKSSEDDIRDYFYDYYWMYTIPREDIENLKFIHIVWEL